MTACVCLQYVIGAIFRDIHIWSATGETAAGGYSSFAAGKGAAESGQPLATLSTPIGVLTDFFVGPDDLVGVRLIFATLITKFD